MADKNERIRLEILDNDSVAHFGGDVDLHFASDVDWMDLFEGSNTSLTGSFDPGGEMGFISPEEDISGSLDTSAPLDDSEEQGFSYTFESTQKTKKGVVPKDILEFEDHALRWSALAIHEAVQLLIRTIDSPDDSSEVVAWLFGKSVVSTKEAISFEQCCYAHNARPDVVRMRLMFELWRKGKFAIQPFQINDYELPDYIFDSLFMERGIDAQRMARALWVFPGATINQLSAIVTPRELNTLVLLANDYYASPSYGELSQSKQRWYLTGINPILKNDDVIRPSLNRQRRIDLSWSQYFPE